MNAIGRHVFQDIHDQLTVAHVVFFTCGILLYGARPGAQAAYGIYSRVWDV